MRGMLRKLAVWVGLATIAAFVAAVMFADYNLVNSQNATEHTVFLNAIEIKGSTTGDKLAPPSINPKDLSKGYGYKALGEADKQNHKKWEVASYMFSPGFVTARQGDRVRLMVFVVNGDKHEVWITEPGGKKVVPNTIWNRGRQYEISFVVEKAGTYELICSDHAPTMTATILVLPR